MALSIATQPAAAETRERPCNGSVELCAMPFDQVVLPGTHNSMSAKDLDWKIPNQLVDIPSQLSGGIRGFLIDTHYGKISNATTVVKVPRDEGHANGDTMYLCHEVCQWGASELIPELAKVRDFLIANPREVLIFMNQDAITPDDFAKAVAESGLLEYVYTGSTAEWPTLREMIAGNQRVVMTAEGNTGTVPWYHGAYEGTLQETPYDFREDGTTQQGIGRLTLPANLNESCRPFRGGSNGSLFLMNHWVNGMLNNSNPFEPDPAVARILNTKDVLVNRARACQQRRGIKPTLIAVDEFGEGDLLGAVRELNGVVAKPFLETTANKRRIVRAGKAATYRVSVSNFGDTGGSVSICTWVPKWLAKTPRCATVEVGVGATASASIKIKTKKRRGKKALKRKVWFKVAAAGDTVSTSSKLKVKPLKKKHKKQQKKKTNKRR